MQGKYIERVESFDGNKTYNRSEILEHEELRKYYAMANVLYKNFIEEINSTEAYLYIEAIGRPVYQIKSAPIELLEKLKIANLG